MQRSYMDYAMSVIIGRALPDVRDGFKPVHRRILYAMYELRNFHNSAYKKSARVVGDVIGKYHPHGDSAVYDTLVRMAQDFVMRVPLVDGQGNFGSIDGDPAAAMRYTEVRMGRICTELLTDIAKETVDFEPNYDESMVEPIVLPARFPNLLVNGSSGIAVGMSTNIPPHNLGEVVEALIKVIDEPEIEIRELIKIIHGPDFPSKGFIYGRMGIHQAYLTGRGIIRLRARSGVETKKKDKQAIIVSELPYMVNKAKLIEKIAMLVRTKKIEGISDLRDESDRDGMRIVIELKRDALPEILLNQLYKTTNLQTSFGIIMLAIVSGQPKVLNIKEVLQHFIDFRREVTTRRCHFELKKAKARAHILEGLKIALDKITEVIALIRASKTGPEAKQGLVETFGLSLIQAQAILDMRLQKLTGLERDKILEEYAAVLAEIERLEALLNNELLMMNLIRGELKEVQEQYASPRLTEIVDSEADLTIEDLVPD